MSDPNGPDEKIDSHDQIELIHTIDRLLCRSVKTLISVATDYQPEVDAHRSICNKALHFPPWIGGDSQPSAADKFLLTRAICCGTLQRLLVNRRRFEWLEKADADRLVSGKARCGSAQYPRRKSLAWCAACLQRRPSANRSGRAPRARGLRPPRQRFECACGTSAAGNPWPRAPTRGTARAS
jgi:hypothetical protein